MNPVIGFDARMIAHSGIGTYTREILKRLTQNGGRQLALFGNAEKISKYQAVKIDFNAPIYSIQEQILFPLLLKKNNIKLLHVPHYNAPLGFKGRLIVTIHDLIHLRFPPSKMAHYYASFMMNKVCKKADLIMTDSFHTKKDIMEFTGTEEKKIRVIYLGFGNPFDETGLKSETNQRKESDYILYVGNIRATKNIKTLVDAFMIAKQKIKEIRLILAGRNSMTVYTDQIKNHPDIKILNELSISELGKLYKNAKLFIFPSLYEGFGLPPLEAMACGVPVICSNAASLPEVAGDAAEMFDPKNVGQLSEMIVELWDNEVRRKELIRRGYENIKRFSWDKCAEEIDKIYEEVSF